MSELNIPESWAEVELGGVIEVRDGTHDSPKLLNTGIKFITSKNLNKNILDLENCSYISKENHDKIKQRSEVKRGDLLMAMIGTIGNPVIVDVDEEFSIKNIALFKRNNYLNDLKILKYFIQSPLFFKMSEELKQGTTQKFLGLNVLRSLKFPLPPSLEQKRIVQKIESCFEKIDATEANLNKIETLLEKYRESLLAKAFRGELVLQDPNDEPAIVLFEKILNERLSSTYKSSQIDFTKIESDEEPSIIPSNWKWVRFGQIADVVRGGSPRPAGDPKFYDGAIPFLKVADLTNDDEIYVQGFESSIKDAGLHKTRMVQKGTLLLTNSGATLGIPKITSFETTFNDGIAAFLNINHIDLEYLYFYLLTRTKWYLTKGAKSQGQPNLNIEIIANSVFPLPPLSEQTKIVIRLKSDLTKIRKILQTISAKKNLLKRLKDSVLQKAFEGKLVEQIPREGTGHELLAKILAVKDSTHKSDLKTNRTINKASAKADKVKGK
jgi:type I restriction enzyme S subunit